MTPPAVEDRLIGFFTDKASAVVTNVPGQSAQFGSPFYDNLLPLWANDTYFPLVYSRARVAAEKAHTLTLTAK